MYVQHIAYQVNLNMMKTTIQININYEEIIYGGIAMCNVFVYVCTRV